MTDRELLLDFETYSEAGTVWNTERRKWESVLGRSATERGLSVVGTKNYVRHPSFELLSLAYLFVDDTVAHVWVPGMPLPLPLLEHVAAGGIVHAWNAGFEEEVWNSYCVPKLGWPPLNPTAIRCDMARAKAFALPGKLEEAGKVLRLNVQKDTEGKKLLKIFSEPTNPTKKQPNSRVLPEDEPEAFRNLLSYNAQDVHAEAAISSLLPELPPLEVATWQCDQRINRRGLGVDVEGVEDCIAIVEQAHARYTTELIAITNGAVNAVSERDSFMAWAASRGVVLPNLTADLVEETLTFEDALGGDLPDDVRRALRIRQILGGASVKKLYAIRHQQHAGRLYNLYGYHSARTGRWNAYGPQPQNFPKPLPAFEKFDEVSRALAVISTRSLDNVEGAYPTLDPLDVVSSCLRSLLMADPGKELICSDFSAIEGAVLASLAGEQWRIDVFRSHGMIYEMSASRITGLPFDEFVKHKKETGKHHPYRQKPGKIAELALGYMGWIGAWRNFDDDPAVTDDEIKQHIIAWRNASPHIVEFAGGQSRGRFEHARSELYGLEGAAIAAVRYPGQAFAANGYVSYYKEGDVLYCVLPSGRRLSYHRPLLAPSRREWAKPWELELTYEGWNTNPKQGRPGWIRMNTYAGKLTENVVQAVARDFQALALMNLEQAGYPPVLHSHDEIACEVDPGFGSVEEFELIGSASPSWARFADGSPWPVKMKGGWRGQRYRKE